MKKSLLVAARVAAIIIAVLFIFSGFVKGIDPLGTTYKLEDYFEAFGMPFFNTMALPLSIVLSASEMLIGLMLLFRVKNRIAAWGALIFMVGFTILTFFLALYNPVTDCGCFGDAIKLSNWGTFYKNLVFLPLTILLFWGSKSRQELFDKCLHSWIAASLLAALAVGISIHSLAYKPIFDFRPFKVGTNLKEAMAIPSGAPVDEYKTTLIYKKDGVEKEFDESNYPWQDSTWVFVDSKSVLVKKGYTPPIANFSLTNRNNEDITPLVTEGTGYTFLLVLPKVEDANLTRLNYIRNLAALCLNNKHNMILATASSWDQIKSLETTIEVPLTMAQADETMLKTIVRSNPGLLLVHNGTIVGKWAWREMPHFAAAQSNPITLALQEAESRANCRLAVMLSLALVILLISTTTLAGITRKQKPLK